MSNWSAYWSGSYPNLCSGYWELYKDDVKVDTKIPFNDGYEDEDYEDEDNDKHYPMPYDAGTLGEYNSWSFGGESGWEEVWWSYEDGLDEDEWCREHSKWLATLAPESEWGKIFRAFQTVDWRRGSCMGCV